VAVTFLSFILVWGAMLALYLLGRGGRGAAGVAITE
jgi:hypothetical protein